ncbi:hypothetical protein PVK63_09375 [Aliivibrio sp. S2TY2]|uniref:hypothetical protein n=1 Tax=unclassified Aliivibrio TaxID=2645654 RepID=UPI0023783E9A|nr:MULTISPECIES: hypothetical protein [unclassified Aliivibrio]MDD9174892.1 hypothetical protein [Aliivibrio sp. S3TY1]MDD9192161.1 hypothetical protein [Aliivibrio sp. S2TY2]
MLNKNIITHYVGNDCCIGVKKNIIYINNGPGSAFTEYYKIKVNFFVAFLLNFEFLTRLFRLGCSKVISIEDGFFIVFNKSCYVVKNRKLWFKSSFIGSRPLVWAYDGYNIYYGEYTSNPERKPVSIYRLSLDEYKWDKINTIPWIRHIHGIHFDKYQNCFWITTGDSNSESFVFRSKNLIDLEVVLSGDQQARVVELVFDESFIYFGSDTPNESNFIYSLDRKTGKLSKLFEVGSSVFHGYKTANDIYFSTVIEPSEHNKAKSSQIWSVKQRKVVYSSKKDMLSMRFFQYGQFFFPVSNGNSNYLIFTPLALECQYKTNIIIEG